jgi:hypothetical protein
MSVANYSPSPFAPGNDPRVSEPSSPRPSGCRAASITSASSIQPWNGREALIPFETRPVIGSESMYHLRNAYRKLDIQTRRGLAEALA